MALQVSQHIQSVQVPIIPIVGEWTRESPGTISLGQGVVAYGPPLSMCGENRNLNMKLIAKRAVLFWQFIANLMFSREVPDLRLNSNKTEVSQ